MPANAGVREYLMVTRTRDTGFRRCAGFFTGFVSAVTYGTMENGL